MAINKVIVIGNLGANPVTRALPSGQNVANFSLATTERFTDSNGAKQESTEWHRIIAFGPLAALILRSERITAQHVVENEWQSTAQAMNGISATTRSKLNPIASRNRRV